MYHEREMDVLTRLQYGILYYTLPPTSIGGLS